MLMAAAFLLLGAGVVLTAMRTVMLALTLGACVVLWRATRARRARAGVVMALLLLLSTGALVVYRTRAAGALLLRDDSARLRAEVGRAGLARIGLHPLFGNGMDAVKRHWSEWGFPGSEMIHLHSTPLQLAFDRGLPALLFWLWIIYALWRVIGRALDEAQEEEDSNRYGVLLGAGGALAGFFASSLVNYNFGDGEVALVFWWLAGTVVVLTTPKQRNAEDKR
jgi:O-antigen ligase